MAASNTPLFDLIELSAITANTTFTTAPGGGGDIIGVVDNATYSDGDSSNSGTQIAELNETSSSNGGTLTIDGVAYAIELIVPDGGGQDVTVTHNQGASSVDLSGDGGSSDVVFIMASPISGGAARYFALVDDGVGDLDGITSIQLRDLDVDPGGDDVKINADQNDNVAPVCFAQGTRIDTPTGERPVESLRTGDQVLTRQAGAQPIRWIGRRKMIFTLGNAAHKPIQIKAGALGPGCPKRNLVVSPQHRMLMDGPIVSTLFGTDQVFAVAKGLIHYPGIRVMAGKRQVTYFSLLLDHHHILTAEGAATESFLPGPIALGMVSKEQRREIVRLFPGLRLNPRDGYGRPACLTLRRTESEALVAALRQTGEARSFVRPRKPAYRPRPTRRILSDAGATSTTPI